MRATVLVNAAAGVRTREIDQECEKIRAGLASRGVDVEVRQVPGPELAAAAAAAAATGVEAVVMAGGDGTISAGGGALAGGRSALGVIPFGTLNHFARDAGIPDDLDAALEVIAAGHARAVDVGQANDRVFLNNASMGFYPEAVADREARQEEGARKWPAMARAALDTYRRLPALRVTLHVAGAAVPVRTPLVFVGNNRYEMSLLSRGRRTSLDGGELWLYVARHRGRTGFLSLVARAIIGRLDQSRDFVGYAAEEFTVDDRRRAIPIALDGELCELTAPLRFRIRKRALRVLVPRPGEAR
jgi:diacylglycerol kinase family enzyme